MIAAADMMLRGFVPILVLIVSLIILTFDSDSELTNTPNNTYPTRPTFNQQPITRAMLTSRRRSMLCWRCCWPCDSSVQTCKMWDVSWPMMHVPHLQC